MLRMISIYDRIEAADERCREIQQELDNQCSPKDTQSLTGEYTWTVGVIIRLCDELLETELEDVYGEEVDFRIKLTHFQENYQNILDDTIAHV